MLECIYTKYKPSKQWNSTVILNIAFLSQLCLIVLQYCLNGIIPDHIPEGVFEKINLNETLSPTDEAIGNILGSLVRWDAVYFLHIAQYGYTYENSVAFFPLFPYLISSLAFFIQISTFSSLCLSSCFILSAVLINTIFFSLATLILYKLSLIVSNEDYNFASVVIILFVFNPSRIFFIAPYSEALFSFNSFAGMLSLYDSYNFKSTFFFALSVATRSNGMLNIGFILHKSLCYIYVNCLKKRRKVSYLSLSWHLICLLCSICVILLPFYYHQNKSRSIFCETNNYYNLSTDFLNPVIAHAFEYNYILPGQSKASYCNTNEFPYSYVQRHYWNVGFLKYFQVKQIPNFILAIPILCLVFFSSYEYFIKAKKINLLINFQVFKSDFYTSKTPNNIVLYSYYLHVYFLALFCFLCIHVQVATRMLASSSPLIYFVLAKYVMERHYLGKCGVIYFFTYCITGVIAFSNYYPWT